MSLRTSTALSQRLDRQTATEPQGDTLVLRQRHGAPIQLPQRVATMVGGLKIKRHFTSEAKHPYDLVQWEKRDVRVMSYTGGTPKVISERLGVEVPSHWDENAVRITVDKYLFGSKPGTPEYEDSLKHAFDRIANTYTVWGWQEGYFAELEDAIIFNEEMKHLLVNQMWAPNSPVWFNVGHWEQWRWGRPDLRERFKGKGNPAYYAKPDSDGNLKSHTAPSTYSNPQASACFLTEVGDSMENILQHLTTEGRIFSSGSGIGINISTLRSSYEPIQGKGKSSGPLSFNRGWDRMAGAIKSGGKTRRAARMVLMYSDHPDIFEFVAAKRKQEDIAKIILKDHNVHVELRAIARGKQVNGTPAEKAAARMILALPLANETKYSAHMDELLYGETLSDQNANHSVSLKGDFWKAYNTKGETSTRWVTKPEHVQKTYKPEELLKLMAEAVYDNGEPGVHNNDWINLWNPVKEDGSISTSNPCSEYLHRNNTSCNLSSFNLFRFFDQTAGVFQADSFRYAIRLAMICADLNVECGGFPIPEIAEGTYRYRTTGIGYANLGGLLMALGIPYDSDEGRWIASQITSLLSASCWEASAEMGRELGSYLAYDSTKNSLHQVLQLHRAIHQVSTEVGNRPDQAKSLVESLYSELRGQLPEAQGLTGRDAMEAFLANFDLQGPASSTARKLVAQASVLASEIWAANVAQGAYRNSFVSCLAPTGCLIEGTMVPTSKGLLKLRDLGNTQGAQWQNVDFCVDTDTGHQKATKFYVNGRAPTRKLRTQHGYTLQGTNKHQIKVVAPNGTFVWKHMEDVTNGDVVPLRMNNLVGNPNTVRLPILPSFHENEANAVVPSFMNSSLAEFLGYFMGDGSLHAKGIRLCVSHEDADVVEHLSTLGQSLFGLKAHIETKQKDEHHLSYFNVGFNSVSLRNWFIASGFAKEQPIENHKGKGKIPHIPRAILETNDPHIYGSFLRGLYEADGTVMFGLPSVSSANEEFIHDIMSLMLVLGMPNTLEDRNTSEKSGKILYRLRIRNGYFMKAWDRWAGFIGERKRSRCRYDYQRTESENIPADLGLIKAMDVNYKNGIPHQTLAKGYITRNTAEKLLTADSSSAAAQELARRTQFTYETITSNTDGGIQSTFDLSVPENVTYVANGFISHNTISAPMGIYDRGTTSAEPDYTLVKYKQLSGGGSMKMFNSLALDGLRTQGYSENLVREAAFEVAGLDGLSVAAEGSAKVVSHLDWAPAERQCGPVRQAWQRVLGTSKGSTSDVLASLTARKWDADLSEDEKLVINGSSHVENLPWLRSEHLAAFDCSATNGDGKRAIHHHGHLKMLGAIQPFVSGASSKTVNLPASATVADIEDSFILCHKLGVKCIAVFRADSKANAVYFVDTPETRKQKAPYIWEQLLAETTAAMSDVVAEASKPHQRKLPGRRLSETLKFEINGHLKGFLTVSVYPDGTCGEVFGRLGQVGSFASSMFESYCKLLSTSLQFGVPLADIIDDFRGMSFEPSGFSKVGDDTPDNRCSEIKSCSSVVDLTIKILSWLFPEDNGYRLRELNQVAASFPWSNHPAGIQPPTLQLEPSAPKPVATRVDKALKNASICPKCNNNSYVQDGRCKNCRNCGYKDGGCGE